MTFNPASLIPIRKTVDRARRIERRCSFQKLGDLDDSQWEQLRYEISQWALANGYRKVIVWRDYFSCELVVEAVNEPSA